MRLREVRSTYRPVEGAPIGPRPQILTAGDAAGIVASFLAGGLVERFGVLSLDTKHRPCGWDIVSTGTLDTCVVHPRDVFRVAILQNAAAIIVAHNHPSGDPTPSADDHEVTRRLIAAAAVIGIAVLDHLIIADETYYSIREHGGMNA
jgi:DNA repair protein RadC